MAKKKKESPALLQKQKSRAKYQCPPELLKLIDEVNLIPYETQMPNLRNELQVRKQALREQTGNEFATVSASEILEICMKDLPKEFQEYLESVTIDCGLPFGDKDCKSELKVELYVEYFNKRDSMLRLVERLEWESQRTRQATEKHRLNKKVTFGPFTIADWDELPIPYKSLVKKDNKYQITGVWDTLPLSITTVVRRNADGKLCITELADLIGKFDDSRLRKCKVCQRIYWAKRENSKTCSPRCLNVLSVRKSRSLTDAEKAERKFKREENRRIVKKGMAKTVKRSNKNGTL